MTACDLRHFNTDHFACNGTGWISPQRKIPCSCVMHTADCEPEGCSPGCPTRAEIAGFPLREDLAGRSDEPLYHFDTLDQLHDWLDSPFREDDVPIDCVKPLPLHSSWENAADAEGWLLDYEDEQDRQIAREWFMGLAGVRGRI